VLAAGLEQDGEALIAGLRADQREYLPLFGAFAADNMRFERTMVFDRNCIIEDGLCVLVVDTDAIDIFGVASHGWRPVGEPRRISASQGNRVYKIDDRPAIETYRDYLGLRGAEDLDLALEFPLQVQRADGSHVLRAVLALHDDGSLVFNANVPAGALAYFSAPAGEGVIDQTVTELRALNAPFPQAQAALLFHCAIRYQVFGQRVVREIEAAQELWQTPLVGLFSYGEIGTIPGSACDFHAATYSLVLLRIRNPKKPLRSAGPLLLHQHDPSQDRQISNIAIEETRSLQSTVADWLAAGMVSKSGLRELHRSLKALEGYVTGQHKHIDDLDRSRLSRALLLTRSSEDLRAANAIVQRERETSDSLLRAILPEATAERMKRGEDRIADRIPHAAVLFVDIAGFTSLAEKVEATELVERLDAIFREFDAITERHGAAKIKTIGDCYMAVAGVPEAVSNPAARAAALALDLMRVPERLLREQRLPESIALRAGLHVGEVVAGVIGKSRFSYDLWGDTVNIASRMESEGVVGEIQCSRIVYESLKSAFDFEQRGKISIKGKGEMETFLLKGKRLHSREP
jgi:class 3 adenylate cyclase